MIPRPVSGLPIFAAGVARRMSAAYASSAPPPSAQPSIAAITGIGRLRTRRKAVVLIPLRASSARRSRSWPISAPEANTPPAPVRISTRGSASRSPHSACRPSTSSWSIALRVAGRSRVATTRSSLRSMRNGDPASAIVVLSPIPRILAPTGITRGELLTDRSEIIPEAGRDRKVPARWCKTEPVTADPVPAAGRRRGRPGYDRDEVLAAAVALFNEQGYDATSVSDLAVRLGLTKSAMYHHFSSKEELLDMALGVALDGLEGVLAEPGAQAGTAAERLQFVLRAAVQVLLDRLPYVTLLLRVRGNSAVERAALERRRAFDHEMALLVREAQASG